MTNESFLKTLSKYPTFLAGALLGVFFSTFAWLKPLFRTRLGAVLGVLASIGAVAFLVLTVRAMLQLR
jgi:hypothetical protein